MNIFNKRPLLLALFVFTLCSVICTFITPNIRTTGVILFLVTSVIAIGVFIVLSIKKVSFNPIIYIVLCLVFALVAFLSSHAFFDKKLSYAESLGDEKNVIAEIRECTFSSSYMTVYTARIISIDGKNTSFDASISFSSKTSFEIGEAIVADMEFIPFSKTEYGFNERIVRVSEGVLTSAEVIDAKVIEDYKGNSIIAKFNKLRQRISEIIDNSGYNETAPLIKALLIGDRNDVAPLTEYNFSRLGVSHILSISGTHFTVILGMLAVLLSVVGINKRTVYFILIPVALFYMGLSGFSFSVCRAGLMSLLSYGAFLFGRKRDSYTALFIALSTIILIAPYAVFSIGLWLSFTATFTILIIIDLLSTKLFEKNSLWFKRLLNYIITHLLVSLSISFSTLPIIVLYFGYLSLVAPLANLIIIPLFEIFLFIIPFSVILSKFKFAVIIAEKYGILLLKIIQECASVDNILISVNQHFVVVISSIGIAITILLLALPLKKKFLIAFPMIISTILIAIGLIIFNKARIKETKVTYFTSSISDGLVITDTNKTMCIDITNGSSASMYYTNAMVKEHYSAKISAYVFTHLRSKHISSFKKLASRMKIEKVYIPNLRSGKSFQYMNSIVSIAKENDIKIINYDYEVPFDYEECKVTVLEPSFIKRTTHEIISVFVSTKQDDFLYLGSSFSEADYDFSEYINDAEYIVFGQHYPKIKERFEINTSAELIYGNETVYDLSDISNEAYVLGDGGKYSFFLK